MEVESMVSDRMRQSYNRIAPTFAQRFADMTPSLERLASDFLERLLDTPVILDAGCGPGRDMAWFEAHGCHVTGIDLSPGMLAEARTRVTGPLIEMDLHDLRLDEQAFDGIWCNAALLHIPKAHVPSVLARFHRALKPNGLLGLGLKQGASEGWKSGDYPDIERYFSLFQEEEIRQLLINAGFHIDSLTTHPGTNVTWIHVIASAT
jgi:SAM-dependent methyltransferase